MAIFIVLLKGLKVLLRLDNGYVNYVRLILQGILGGLFVKFFVIYLTILEDNYINFLTEKQELIQLMYVTVFLLILSYLQDSFVDRKATNMLIVPGIIGSVILDIDKFMVIF